MATAFSSVPGECFSYYLPFLSRFAGTEAVLPHGKTGVALPPHHRRRRRRRPLNPNPLGGGEAFCNWPPTFSLLIQLCVVLYCCWGCKKQQQRKVSFSAAPFRIQVGEGGSGGRGMHFMSGVG